MTDRDSQVYEFLNNHSCFTDTINKMFYKNICVCNRRLAWLHNNGYIKRSRDRVNEPYFYYTKSTKQKKHMDYIAKIHLWMKLNNFKVLEYQVQTKVKKCIPDLVLNIQQSNGKIGTLIAEVELSGNKIDNKLYNYSEAGFNNIIIFTNKKYLFDIEKHKNMKINTISISELDNLM